MPKENSTFDVFISHAREDSAISAHLARVLRSYDLRVFMDPEVSIGGRIEDEIWEAMSESQALVAVIPETYPNAWITFEVGAAKAWNKPIYAVASNPAVAHLPIGFEGIRIYPPSRMEEIAQEIKKASGLLTESDQTVLIEVYHRIGVAVDQLLLQPDQLSKLTKQFRKHAKKNVASEELVRTLLRLRKQGKLRLPSAKKQTKTI